MKRWIAVTVATAALLLSGVSAAKALPRPDRDKDWFCVYERKTLDIGYCQQNPLPRQLPIP